MSASPPIGYLSVCVCVCSTMCLYPHILFICMRAHERSVSGRRDKGLLYFSLSLVCEWMCASVCSSSRLSNRPFVKREEWKQIPIKEPRGFLGLGKIRGVRKEESLIRQRNKRKCKEKGNKKGSEAQRWWRRSSRGLIVVIFSFWCTTLDLSREICRIQTHAVHCRPAFPFKPTALSIHPSHHR